MGTKKKPAIARQEDWTRRSPIYTETAHWMMGNIYIIQSRFGPADSNCALAAVAAPKRAIRRPHPVLSRWSNYKLEK